MNRRCLSVVSLLSALALFAGCSGKPAVTQGKGAALKASKLVSAKIESKLLKKEMKLNIYLPEGYGKNEKYPVLYMLHGYSGDEDSWISGQKLDKKADALIKDGKIRPMIIVTPQIDNSYGINSSENPKVIGVPPRNSLNEGMYEDYIIKELIPYIDSGYSTVAERNGRYIGGMSMGGFAALRLAFLYPDMFGKAGGHSPAVFMDSTPDVPLFFIFPNEEKRKERDLLILAKERDFKDLKVYLDCGKEDSYRFYEGCEKLYAILKEKGIEAEYHLKDGKHDGAYWTANMEQYLLFYGSSQ